MPKIIKYKATDRSTNYRVTIPPEHIKNLGWGDGTTEVIVESNKSKDEITIRRIK